MDMETEQNYSMKYKSMIYKVSLVVIIGISLVLSSFGIYIYKQNAEELMDELNNTLVLSTKRIANSLSNPLYNYDTKTIQSIALSEMENKLISGIFIWETGDEKVLFGYVRGSEGTIIIADKLLPSKENISGNSDIRYGNKNIGKVKVYLTKKYLTKTLEKIMLSSIFQIIISDAVLAVIMIAMINIIIISPISQLTKATIEMSSGNLDQSIKINSKDEIGMLGNSFLLMRDAVVEKIANLEKQKKELNESQNARQEFIDAMTTFSAKITLDGIVAEVNQTAVDMSGNRQEKIIGRPFRDGSWWSYDRSIQNQLDEAIKKAGSGKPLGYNVKIMAGDDNYITIAFNLQPVFDDSKKVKYLIAEGRDISHLKETEAELEKHRDHLEELVNERTVELKEANRSLARLKTAIEQSMDGIAVVDNNGYIIFVNKAWARMHGWETDELQGEEYNLFHTKEQLLKEVNYFKKMVRKNGKNEGEVPHVRKNGTEFPTWMSVSELREDNWKEETGNVIGIVCIARDITEQIKAETDLAAAQNELIEKAHQAGMADIATGTLHNVGNILNSVKTSTYVITDVLKRSSLEGFIKANGLLKENIDNIEDFIVTNPKGLKLMKYFLKLEDSFKKEEEKINKHLIRMKNKVEAISEVITAQQNYAGANSLNEKYELSEIVEDALTMQAGSMERYNIVIEKDFRKVPQVSVQKTKLVHILINLIQNAKDAMLEMAADKRRLKFMIYSENGAIFIKACDTGSGIKRENLDKVFSHGFTTKKSGHGFGLHSSANYMSEMGGRMWAESKGVEEGAEFYLRFPISLKAEKINN